MAEIGGNSENSSKSELEEHKISEHNINDKSDNSECKNKDTKLRTPISKTDIDDCTEKGAKRFEQDEFKEIQHNQHCFVFLSSDLDNDLRVYICVLAKFWNFESQENLFYAEKE